MWYGPDGYSGTRHAHLHSWLHPFPNTSPLLNNILRWAKWIVFWIELNLWLSCFNQGWEFYHRFFERITHFLWAKVQNIDSIMEIVNRSCWSFLKMDGIKSLSWLFFKECKERNILLLKKCKRMRERSVLFSIYSIYI